MSLTHKYAEAPTEQRKAGDEAPIVTLPGRGCFASLAIFCASLFAILATVIGTTALLVAWPHQMMLASMHSGSCHGVRTVELRTPCNARHLSGSDIQLFSSAIAFQSKGGGFATGRDSVPISLTIWWSWVPHPAEYDGKLWWSDGRLKLEIPVPLLFDEPQYREIDVTSVEAFRRSAHMF